MRKVCELKEGEKWVKLPIFHNEETGFLEAFCEVCTEVVFRLHYSRSDFAKPKTFSHICKDK